MVERRPCSPWMVTTLAGLVCLSVWQIIGCPEQPNAAAYIVTQQQPSYPLLLTANTTTDPPYDMERLSPDDYSRLMNFSDFRFTMLGSVCNSSRPPLLLVMVHSAPGNKAKRASIRSTWGAPRDSMHLVFLVGAVDKPQTAQRLQIEQQRHGDLIQGNFRDAYRNMTYKHVMALKYAAYHCSGARLILKTDDDVFVNMPTMMAFLNVELSTRGARRLLFCQTFWKSFPKRSFRSKWRVSFKEYREKQYPPYCSGWAILYSPDVVFTLYQEAQKSDYFWIDDVLLTGILSERAHVEHTNVDKGLILPRVSLNRLLKGNTTDLGSNFLYGPVNMTPSEIHALWKIVDKFHQNVSTTAATYKLPT